ncbi:MAG: spermine/spermidine synthase domain-containing protein, partial [Planctomycetota bacterium]
MSRAWSAVVFSLGLFALVAQTLLFRSFLTTFEGSELGIGSFFGSWLLWVALGALVGRAASRIARLKTSHFVTLTLLYLPAYLLQDHWLRSARAMAGVGAYEVFELPRMIATALWVNAPVSLLTGFLFTLACRSAIFKNEGLPVARLYVLESLGAFVGGIAVTLFLAAGVAEETVFLGAAFALALAVAVFHGARRPFLHGVPLLAVAIVLLTGLDSRWQRAHDEAAWAALHEAGDYQGSFATAQGRYLFGQREGQFVVMSWGGVSETLPNTEHASEVVALSLAQHPGARRVLVVGPGSLSVCRRLAQLPSVERVAWLHPDPDYPDALRSHLPARFRKQSAKLEIPKADVRAFLERSPGEFDLALLNLPDVTTLVLNRYSTQEFYDQLKRALSPGGTIAVRLSGGANYLGSELVYLGASAYLTLKSAFENVALKPGEESWLIASDGDGPASSPALLRDRFAAIDGAAAVFPPAALLTLYPPDRIAFQIEQYERMAQEAGAEILANTDARPRALLYGLAVALRQAGRRAVAHDVSALVDTGAKVAAAAVLLFLLVRLYYLLTSPARRRGLFDGGFLVFSTGIAGMSASVVLMLLYQARYGSLYLHAGLVFSLFMLGLFSGGLLCERILGRRRAEPRGLLPLLLMAHLLALAAIGALPADATRPHFALLFVLSGLFTGVYFPIAAHRMRAAGTSPAAAGARLEFIDHLGGAAG